MHFFLQELSGQGQSYIEALHSIAMGDVARARVADRISAITILLERGWGKVPQAVTGPEGGPLQVQMQVAAMATLADEQLEMMIALAARVQTEPNLPGDNLPGDTQ